MKQLPPVTDAELQGLEMLINTAGLVPGLMAANSKNPPTNITTIAAIWLQKISEATVIEEPKLKEVKK